MTDLAYVIPAFNAAGTVGATLRSVLSQRAAGVCAIVVDDGSDDGTGDVARAQRDWRIQVVRQANQGLAGARNTGFEVLADRARAVCFLDADDTVEAGHAARLCEALLGHADHTPPGADLAACAYRMVGPNLENLGWTIDVAPGDVAQGRMAEFNPLAVGAVAARVDVLRDVAGDRPFDQTLPVHEDWDLWLRLTAAGCRWAPPAPEHLFNYRIRPGSLSRAVEPMWRVGLRVIQRGTPAPACDGAMRRWTLRHLARAAVAASALVPEMLEDLRSRGGAELTEPDLAAFLGSLRHAFMLENAAGPDAAPAFEAPWKERARSALAPWPEGAAAVQSLSFTSWEGVAGRLARLLRGDGRGRLAHLRPVIAGMGRNGRALAQAMATRAIAFDWLDDDAAAACPLVGARRLDADRLGPAHLVIITPASADGLTARLRESRALVMRPCDLLEHAHEEPAHRRVA